MRFVIRLDGNDPSAFVADFSKFIQDLLDKKAKGLLLNQKKTQVMYGNRDSPNVPVADAMQAVNNNVSGPLDVETARHALEMLDGLLAVSNSRRARLVPQEPLRTTCCVKSFRLNPMFVTTLWSGS